MISIDQLREISKELKINESVVAREYFQYLFLNELYSKSFSDKIFFKGGTAIRLLYGGKRFSEDLDFTVMLSEEEFEKHIKQLFEYIENTYPIHIKNKKTITGKSYLLTCIIPNFNTDIYIKLDFSFRESVLEPTKLIISSRYPIITSNYINALSMNEIIAEKVRAIMTRNKPRDIYDLWIVQELGGEIDIELINNKLAYYNEVFEYTKFLEKLSTFTEKEFIIDLRPFIPTNEREQLSNTFSFTKEYCIKKLSRYE